MNPAMLEFQYKNWANYSDEIKPLIEIIVFDDCSPTFPAIEVPLPENLPNFSLYRMLEDVPWGSDACRNRASSITTSEFILLCDIDHVMPEDTLRMLLDDCDGYSDNEIITFPRIRGSNSESIHPGANIYMMRRKTFWEVGGYDEYLLGLYCTDVPFRERLYRNNTKVESKLPLVVYSKDTIPNCDTSTYKRSRDDLRKINERIKEKEARGIKEIVTLSKPFEKLI